MVTEKTGAKNLVALSLFFVVLGLVDILYLTLHKFPSLAPHICGLTNPQSFDYDLQLFDTLRFALIPPAMACLFGRFAKIPVVMAFCAMFFAQVISMYADFAWGMDIPHSIYPLLACTSHEEIIAFLRMILSWKLVVATAFLFALLVFGCRFIWTLELGKPSLLTVFAGIVMLSPFISMKVCALVCNGTVVSRFTQVRFYGMALNATADTLKQLKVCETPHLPDVSMPPRNPNTPPDLFVIVIGESNTRRHWHLYGYHRNTTPEMDRLAAAGNLLVFHAWTPVAATSQAVMSFLSDKDYARRNETEWYLPQLVAKAGFKSVLVSAPFETPSRTNPLYSVFNGVDTRFYRTDFMQPPDSKMADAAAVDKLLSVIKENSSLPLVVFMHQVGSHYPATFYPKTETVWECDATDPILQQLPDEARSRCNTYDNNIRWTDKTLGRIATAVDDSGRPAAFMYFSDHGESPSSDQWRKFCASSCYEIPLVIHFSSEFRRIHPRTVEYFNNAAKEDSVFIDRFLPQTLKLLGISISEDQSSNPDSEETRQRQSESL